MGIMKRNTLTVIGLGKLGLPTAACLSDKGFRVIGVDIDPHVIDAINNGVSPLYEPGLGEMMERVKGRFTATDDYQYAIDNSAVIFIFVGTPSESDGSFSTRYVEEVTRRIASNIRDRDDFPIIVLRSTVLPGVTDGLVKTLLEEITGKCCGIDFGLCYNPEILALGSVIHDFLNPDMVVIGESDQRSGKQLSEIYSNVCENRPPVIKTSLANAEMAKISLNVFLTLKMSFANTLAEICEMIPQGDVDAVSDILGRDRRIGRKFLTGATGWGGPCFPRDTKAFISLAERNKSQAKLAEATDAVNDIQCQRIIELVGQKLAGLKGKRIAVLGLTYKPNTDLVLESESIRIINLLLKEGATLSLYDPAGLANAREELGEDVVYYAQSAVDCLRDADLCIMATPWEEFNELTPEDFAGNMNSPVLLDCWRQLRRPEFTEKLDYLAIGLNTLNE